MNEEGKKVSSHRSEDAARRQAVAEAGVAASRRQSGSPELAAAEGSRSGREAGSSRLCGVGRV